MKLKINSIEINETGTVELIGFTIDNTLPRNGHINNFCRKVSYKLYQLCRIRTYLSQDQAKLLYNAFINSQFNYARIIKMLRKK